MYNWSLAFFFSFCTWLDALIAYSGDVHQSFCVFTFRLVKKDLCRPFSSFARAHKRGFGLIFFNGMHITQLYHFVQNMSGMRGDSSRHVSDICGAKQEYGSSVLLQRPKCAARLPQWQSSFVFVLNYYEIDCAYEIEVCIEKKIIFSVFFFVLWKLKQTRGGGYY